MNPSTAPSNVPVTDRKTRNLLAGILLLGFLLRIVIVFFVPLLHMHRDTYDYYRQADIILMGGYLNYFPNGYPFIVAIAKTLSESHSQLILLWLNIIMSLATVYFVYDIGRRVFGKVTIGLAAAFLMAVFPPLLNYVRWIMSETPT
ncbi:MAG TPA: glycosyltransferase family 39 protein, partial [Puia sp.]|nr:glycosyltransferase family 39 protein [Puia sp.]